MKQRIPYLMVCCLFLLSLVGGILPTLSARAAGGTVSFAPVADAFVNQAYSSTNYGSSESLRVDNSPLTHSYLRFEVKGLNGAPVTAAKLRVYANSSNSTGYIVSQVSDTSWGEKTINYSNAPALGSQIKTSSGFSGGNWTEVDVSSYVRAEGTYSFGLSTQSDTSTNLASREDTTHPPALIVSVSTTSPTIAPTGSSTAAATAAPTTASISPQGSDPQPSFPIRAAFYYPWFPQAWTQLGIYPYTNYNPTLGFYSNADLTTVKQHINMMQYANIQAGIASWWGQGSQTDSKIAGLLSAASGTSFRWALYYEPEGQGNPSSSQIQNDLTYIRDHYGKDPSYLRVGGKFVIFVYADATDACGMADRWKAANTVGAYVVLKVFPGYGSCASQPDSWHQYSPAVATDQQGSYSYTISPGFWKKGESVRLARDLTRWTSNVKSMAASGTKWQLVTTFSEWGEGTAVEPAKEWASSSGYGQYLD
ncbi:MAG TPA: DNRLRE domain-containing protein, partial [Anaerolineales bacterium]